MDRGGGARETGWVREREGGEEGRGVETGMEGGAREGGWDRQGGREGRRWIDRQTQSEVGGGEGGRGSGAW